MICAIPMFKVELLCEDKNLAKLLRLLAGAGAMNVSSVPVIEGLAAGPRLNGLNAAGSAVLRGMMADKLTVITPKEAAEYLKSAGLSRGSATYALNNLIAAKQMKRKEKGKYEIVRAK